MPFVITDCLHTGYGILIHRGKPLREEVVVDAVGVVVAGDDIGGKETFGSRLYRTGRGEAVASDEAVARDAAGLSVAGDGLKKHLLARRHL